MSQTPAALPALDRFYTTLRRSPVVRTPGGPIGGVCAGLAKRLDLSVTVVRIAVVILALLGPAVTLYLLAWLLLPDAGGSIRLERALRRSEGSSIALLVVTVLALLSDLGVRSRGGFGWLSLVLIAAVAWAFYRAGSRPVTTPGAPPTPSDPAPPVAPR